MGAASADTPPDIVAASFCAHANPDTNNPPIRAIMFLKDFIVFNRLEGCFLRYRCNFCWLLKPTTPQQKRTE
jgi:hypothetical protein